MMHSYSSYFRSADELMAMQERDEPPAAPARLTASCPSCGATLTGDDDDPKQAGYECNPCGILWRSRAVLDGDAATIARIGKGTWLAGL